MGNMIGILSTVILVSTLATLIFAVGAYVMARRRRPGAVEPTPLGDYEAPPPPPPPAEEQPPAAPVAPAVSPAPAAALAPPPLAPAGVVPAADVSLTTAPASAPPPPSATPPPPSAPPPGGKPLFRRLTPQGERPAASGADMNQKTEWVWE